MKFTSLLLTSAAMFIAVPAMAQNASAPAAQNTGAASTTQQANTQQDTAQMQNTASEVLGNINIADIALAYGMNDDASSHIDAARGEIAQLTGEMALYQSNVPMTAGKLSYKTANGNSDYWIPVVNDHFVIRTVNGKHLDSKTPEVDVTDAQIVHYKIVLDTKVADEQLAKAQNALNQKQYDVAIAALDNISKAAISETVVSDRPMEAARDNLILSKELLEDKDYRGASYALKHAGKQLAQVQKDNPGSKDNADIKDMQSQIDSLEIALNKQHPTMLKTAEIKVKGWIKNVEAKIHS